LINAETPRKEGRECKGCGGAKGFPLCADLSIGFTKGFNATLGDIEDDYIDFSLCTECGSDLVNALGFFVIRTKLDQPKKKTKKK
jgi:hypothetical protein